MCCSCICYLHLVNLARFSLSGSRHYIREQRTSQAWHRSSLVLQYEDTQSYLCYFAGGPTYSHTSTGTPHATHPPTQPLLDRHMVDNSANEPQQWNSGAATQHPNYGAVGSYGGFVGQSSPLHQGGRPSVYTAEPGNRAPEPGNQNHMYQRQQHRDV